MIIGYKQRTEAVGTFKGSVGEHSIQRRRRAARHSGAYGKANVGISNDKEGAIPSRRKTKVSRATSFAPG